MKDDERKEKNPPQFPVTEKIAWTEEEEAEKKTFGNRSFFLQLETTNDVDRSDGRESITYGGRLRIVTLRRRRHTSDYYQSVCPVLVSLAKL